MSKKNLFLIIGVCLVGAILVLAMNRYSEKAQASGGTEMYEQINSKALSAQSGGQAAISDLVDTIFVNEGISQLDPNLIASLKDRIVRAELNGHTVGESQVVQAMNWLAADFSAPMYAQTSSVQTRALRLDLNHYMPDLFVDRDTQGMVGVNKSVNSQPSNDIAPAQAVTLLLIMIEQKMSNDFFQKEPSQWDADFYAADQSGAYNVNNYENNPPQITGGLASSKNEQMRQLLYGRNFTPYEIDRLTHGVLDQLGIPR